jgi:hypothetical protein
VKRRFILLFGACVFAALSSCLEEVSIEEFTGEPSGRLVIEGLITNERKAHYVKLTRTTNAIPKEPAPPVAGASVSVSDGTNVFYLFEDSIPGVYLTDTTVQGEVGKIYTLSVYAEGKRYQAEDRMEATNDFNQSDGLQVSRKPQGSGGFISQLFTVLYGADKPSMVSIEIVNPRPEDETKRIWYYSFPGSDADNLFPTPTESLNFVPGTIFRQTKYALSDGHYLFLRAMLLETLYKGGIFGSVRANVPTNITNGALGFFGACSVKKRMTKMN